MYGYHGFSYVLLTTVKATTRKADDGRNLDCYQFCHRLADCLLAQAIYVGAGHEMLRRIDLMGLAGITRVVNCASNLTFPANERWQVLDWTTNHVFNVGERRTREFEDYVRQLLRFVAPDTVGAQA